MQYVDCGHEFMTMVIIFSTLVVKIRTCGHKIGTILAHFGVQGMSFARSVCVFSRILLPTHKKNCIPGGLGPAVSSYHLLHLFFSASPRAVQQSYGLSVCEWPVWLFLLLSPRSTPRTVGCTPHLWKAASVSMFSGRTNSFFFVQTHRLVPFTRYYVLLCGRYSR
jgi:hypothetical protein